MFGAIELQVISKLLTTEAESDIDKLCGFDSSYYVAYKDKIEFILDHRQRYGEIPDVFTFQAEFPDVNLVQVSEPITYLCRELQQHKKHIILIDTFNKLKELGSSDATAAWKYIAAQYEKVCQLSDSHPLDIIKQAKERAETVKRYASQARIPTGFPEIDKLMYGGMSTVEEFLLILARTNSGKAQPLDAPVLTPSGWTTMGQLKIGDVVVGKNNDNGKVVQIFPQGRKEYYRVHFDDGTYVECCDDHLWEVLDSSRRQRANKHYGEHLVLSLKEIRADLSKRYSVDISDAIEFESDFDETAELDGYLLGLLIGDGSLRDNRAMLTNDSEEIWSYVCEIIKKYNCVRSTESPYSIISNNKDGSNFVRRKLEEYGLLGKKSIDKFIPKQFLTAPIHVRKALLAGLVDTDGYAPKDSAQLWEFDTASSQLADDFAELARSLGVRVKVHPRKPSYYTVGGSRISANGSIHITCRSEFNPFRLSDKANRLSFRTEPYRRSMPKRHCKMIESVEYIGKTECQCILLDNVSHTYITNDYTVTHNTWILTKMMEAAQNAGFRVLFYSPEMQGEYIGARFDSWRGHFQNSQLYQGKYTEEYLNYLESLSNNEISAFVLEDKHAPEGKVDVPYIQSLVKRLNINLVIIDGLSYLEDARSDNNRSQSTSIKYKNICEDLFNMSKQYHCAVVASIQANRETRECKDDKGEPFPSLYNASESDHPGRIATQAFAVRQIFEKHVIDIRLEKTRIANNQKPILSYAWDVNTGNTQFLPGGQDDATTSALSPVSISGGVSLHNMSADSALLNDEEWEDDVEF